MFNRVGFTLAQPLVPQNRDVPSPIFTAQSHQPPDATDHPEPEPHGDRHRITETPPDGTNGTDLAVVPFHQRQETQTSVIYHQLNNVLDDVEKLASRLSSMFISCETFIPGFFDRIRDIEQWYVVSKSYMPEILPVSIRKPEPNVFSRKK